MIQNSQPTMHLTEGQKIPLSIAIAVLSTIVIFALFMWEGSKGFYLTDEGYLWYGAQRALLGEVPIRDFMSYDPGRYYWAAGFMSLWGDNGVLTLRAAVAVFQALGLFVGLYLIVGSSPRHRLLYALLSAVTLAGWMFPYHKMFDISVSIFLIGALSFLARSPTRMGHFCVGVCVGLAAVFGCNHGVYGAVASLAVMALLSIKRTTDPGFVTGVVLWAAGVIVGFAPTLFMALLVPGFAEAYWERLFFGFDNKFTNLTVPVPWPWLVDFAALSFGKALREVLIGLCFVAIIVFGVFSSIWAIRQKLQNKHVPPVLVAAAFLALPYAHHAFARAHAWHLAQGIFPLVIGCLVFLAAKPAIVKWPLSVALCVASVWVTHVYHPGWQCRAGKDCEKVEVSGDLLDMPSSMASDVRLLKDLVAKYASDGRSYVVTPFWPGAYALLEGKSPMWEIYALRPRTTDFQLREIERIRRADPAFVLVIDTPLDGRDDLRFRNTHSEVYNFMEEEFQRVDGETNQPDYLLFKK
jgi:hypothetical protein